MATQTRSRTNRRKASNAPAPKRKRGEKMTPEQLLSVIDYREERSDPGDLFEEEQQKALQYYFGEKFGNEDPDRSSLVMREVYGVIEWIKPALMKVFFGSERVLEFTPNGPQDVDAAVQETQYIDHIVQKRNDGFPLFYSWFTDAMLCKNGYVLAYWDERIDVTEDVYHDVDEDTLSLLMQEHDIEILEQEQTGEDEFGPLYKVRVREKTSKGCVKLKNIPPERVRIDAAHESVSLKDARYVRYRERQTISELREQGFDVPDDIGDDGDGDDRDRHMEDIRRQRTYNTERAKDEDDPDPASREVDVDTCWVRVDADGDGVAELRRVIRVGNTVLYDEVDGAIYLFSLTPTIIAHRHHGLSIADAVCDIQEAKTVIVRGYLDNIFLANNGRYFVDDDRVNLDDMLVSRPGGVVRVTGGVANAAQPFQHPVLGGAIIQAAEYLDNVLENRTGASPRVLQGQSFDGDAINRTATGISTVMSSVMSRIELIARIFAETGVQDLYRGVHSLSLRYQRKQDVFEVTGNWVPVDPTTWVNRDHMTVNVGSVNKQEKIQLLQMLIAGQQAMVQAGLASPENIHYSLSKLTQIAGFKEVDRFWTKPQQGQPPQQPQDPSVAAEQAKLQMEAKIREQEVIAKQRKIDADVHVAEMKTQADQEAAFLDQVTKLALASMQSDDAQRQAGGEIIDEEQPTEPPSAPGQPSMQEMMQMILAQMSNQPRKPKAVVHHRDANGRLTHSEPVYEE